MDKEKLTIINFQELSSNPKEEPEKMTPQFSSFYSIYQELMEGIREISISQHLDAFYENDIEFHPCTFYPMLETRLIFTIEELNCFILKASISYFTLQISLYIQDSNQIPKNLQIIGKGSFATVYRLNQDTAMKFYLFVDTQKLSVKFQIKQILQEFCLNKIFGILGLAPKVKNPFGFDLVIFKKGIEFAMQICSQPQNINQKKLLSLLKTMHTLQIVHGDIKYENIAWSDEQNKNVFIDFNCSSALKQKLGFKSLTRFRGTLSSVSEEMKVLWKKQTSDWIDLYYNDLVGIQKMVCLPPNEPIKIKRQSKTDQYIRQMIKCCCLHLTLRHNFVFEYSLACLSFVNKNKKKLEPSENLKGQLVRGSLSAQKAYHQIYENIIVLIKETLNFIEIQCFLHDEKEKLKMRQFYLQNFSHYLSNEAYETKKMKFDSNLLIFKGSQISEISPQKNIYDIFFNSQKKEGEKEIFKIDLQRLKKVFYNSEQIQTLQSLESFVSRINRRLKLPETQERTLDQNVLKIREKLKSDKYQKQKINKIPRFYLKSQSTFLVNLLAHLLLFSQALFLQNYSLQRKIFAFSLSDAARVAYKSQEKKMFGLRKVIHQLNRIFNFKKLSQNQLDKFQKKMLKLNQKNFVDSSITLIVHSLQISVEEGLSDGPEKIAENLKSLKKLRKKQRIFEPRIPAQNFFERIQSSIGNDVPTVKLQFELMNSIVQVELIYLDLLVTILKIVPHFQFTENRSSFYELVLTASSHYFCYMDLHQHVNYRVKQIVCEFNSIFSCMVCLTRGSKKSEQSLQKYSCWLLNQRPDDLFEILSKIPLFLVFEMGFQSKKLDQFIEKLLEKFDLFTNLSHNNITSFASLLNYQLDRSYLNHKKYPKNYEVDILIEVFTYLQAQRYFYSFPSYFLFHEDYTGFFRSLRALLSHIKFKEQTKSVSCDRKYSCSMIAYKIYQDGYLTEPFLEALQNILSSLVLSEQKQTQATFIFFSFNLANFFLRQVVVYLPQPFKFLLLTIAELTLAVILKNSNIFGIQLKNRMKEEFPAIISQILKYNLKHKRKSKIDIFSRINTKKLKLFQLHQSIIDEQRISSLQKFYQNQCRRVKRKVRRIMLNKFQKIVDVQLISSKREVSNLSQLQQQLKLKMLFSNNKF